MPSSRPPLRFAIGGERDVIASAGMTSSSHPLATAAGLEMLARGGNAVDAALATALALVVVEPAMSHLGGQCNAIVHIAAEGRSVAIDGYPTAPAAAREDMYEWVPSPTQGGYRFWTKDDRNTTGALSVAVPGFVAALLYAHERWATLPLTSIAAPAIRHARGGTRVARRLASHIAEGRERLARFPATAALWLHADGTPLAEGDVVVQDDLARTVERLARDGHSFSRGELATAIAAFLGEQGGVLARGDLERYADEDLRVIEPERAGYRGFTVEATPLSSSAVLLPILRLLEGFDLSDHGPLDADKLHVLIECMKLGFADRLAHVGDPAFVDVPIAGLLSDGYVSSRRATIRADHAGAPGPGNPWAYDGGHGRRAIADLTTASTAAERSACTTHHSHVDRHGNFVSWTQSQGDAFGSAMVVPGYGFFLNNAMKLFDPRPGRPHSIAPRKRPATAPCPTLLLLDGRPVLALGSPSGTRIISAVAQVIADVVDRGMGLQAAIDLPRLHWSGDELEIESDLPAATQAALEARGHVLERRSPRSPWFGAVQAVARDTATGVFRGAADPRRDGAAAGLSG